MLKRFTLSFLALTVVAATLTGCVPQSRDSLDRYVDALDAIPGVNVDYYGVSTPLPFSVQGTVDLSFDADAATLAELQRVGCDTEVNASVSLSIAARAGETAVRFDDADPCTELPVDLVGLALATEAFAVTIAVDDIGQNWIAVSDEDDLAQALDVLRAATDFLPAGSVHFTGEGIDLDAPDLDLAAAYLDDFSALVDAFGIGVIDLHDDSLVVQTVLPADREPVEEFLTARNPSRYGALTIVVTDVASGNLPSGTDASVIETRDRIVAELGISAKVAGNTVYVQALDGDEVIQLSEQIAAINSEAVRIGITIVGDEEAGIPQFRVDEEPGLTPTANPYPGWGAQYERLIATDLVGTVEVSAGTLAVWLWDADYDDPDALAAVRAVLDDIAEADGLTYWELNNRDLTGS